MLQGVLGWVFVGIFVFVFYCYWQVLPPTKPFNGIRATLCASKSIHCCEFLVFGTHVFKSYENEIFGLKRCRSSVVLHVYGHEMIKDGLYEERTTWK